MQNHIRTGAAIVLLAAIAGCTSPAGPSGAATQTSFADSCINTQLIKRQTIVSDREIRFEMNNGDVWVNQLAHRCSGLKSEDGFSWSLHTNRACSNQEIIHVFNNAGSCALGEFKKQPPTPT